MTRWPKTYAILTGEPVLTEAQRRAAEASARALEAEQRGDDRELGRARMELQQAQHDRLGRGE